MDFSIVKDIEISEEDLINNIVDSNNHYDILEFIKNLDARMEDWSFTNDLYYYFKEQHELYKQVK